VNYSRVGDTAPLIVRLAQGSLMAGHGAQKLFGSFGGPGLEGTSGFMEMLGMRPGRPWAYLAGLSEFGGGVLTALGLFNPLGPLGVIAAMSMATRKAHWGKPIWVTEGGAELPVLNIAISTALMIREPDGYSLDRVLGIRLPGWVGPLGLVGIILTVLYAELEADKPPEQEEAQGEGTEDEAREELAGESSL
jgi:putative oxidoreductase